VAAVLLIRLPLHGTGNTLREGPKEAGSYFKNAHKDMPEVMNYYLVVFENGSDGSSHLNQ
jgi:hypothetical protein